MLVYLNPPVFHASQITSWPFHLVTLVSLLNIVFSITHKRHRVLDLMTFSRKTDCIMLIGYQKMAKSSDFLSKKHQRYNMGVYEMKDQFREQMHLLSANAI
jgi:hypothetical protein